MLRRISRRLKREFNVRRIPTMSLDNDAYFGELARSLKSALEVGGSELGLGLTLFSLVVSTRAEKIIEIGRFKGFSTLALAGGLRFVDWGWTEPKEAMQRHAEIDYEKLHGWKERRLYSIDPTPTKEAEERVRRNNLSGYVEFINANSQDVKLDVVADVLFIDGDHSYEGCRRDVEQYVTHNLKQGGYFVLHDYFGWFDEHGTNKSPIKKVCDELEKTSSWEHILIDTHYASFKLFRT